MLTILAGGLVVVARQFETPFVFVVAKIECRRKIAEIAAIDFGFHAPLIRGVCYNVDSAAESRQSELADRRSLQNFDTFHRAQIERDVEIGMAGMYIGDVHAVEQNQHLVECAAAHRDVGLCPVGSACADVDAG